MDTETFRKRFVNYSDKELILMSTKNAAKYNPDALMVAKQILINRKVDIETILKEEENSKPKVELDEEEIEKKYVQSLSQIEQIGYLSEKRIELEENIEEVVLTKIKNLKDEELVQNFEGILDSIIKAGDFGEITEIHSRENYFYTSNFIKRKNLKLSIIILMKVDFVSIIATRVIRKRAGKQILYGILLLILGLIFTIATEGNIIMYGAILLGFGLFVIGIKGKVFAKKYLNELSESYS